MVEKRYIKIDNFEFDCRICGEDKNELVILLHGFPETSIMWQTLMPEIAAKGLFCVAPNMRGYSRNASPKGKENYTINKISKDILDIADALQKDRFHLAGHDWGAAIGWNIAFNNPEKVLTWSALSVPHPKAFSKAIKLNKDQKKRSRYMALFLIPWLPEWVIQKNDFSRLRRLWKNSSADELEDYLSVFRRKGALTGALNYYRANIGKSKGTYVGDITATTLFIWGKKDIAIGVFAAESNHKYMKGAYKFLAVDGGHWLIQTNYAEVKNAILDHILNYKTAKGKNS